jgi:hypothetical protein
MKKPSNGIEIQRISYKLMYLVQECGEIKAYCETTQKSANKTKQEKTGMKKVNITVPVYFWSFSTDGKKITDDSVLVFQKEGEIQIGNPDKAVSVRIHRNKIAMCCQYYPNLGITPECKNISLTLTTFKPKRKNILEMTVTKGGFIIFDNLETGMGIVQSDIHFALYKNGYQKVYLSAKFSKPKKLKMKKVFPVDKLGLLP